MNTIHNYSLGNYNKSNLQKNCNISNMSFKAKFPLADIEMLIKEQSQCGKDNIIFKYPQAHMPQYPQLYTFLKRLAEIKEGGVARLKLGELTHGGWSTPARNPRIEIDGELFTENKGGDQGLYWFDTLQKAILEGTGTNRNNKSAFPTFAMPKSVFEQTWWEHRNVTADDIRNLAIDA